MAFFRAYLDESERFKDQKVFAVSCLAFTKNRLEGFIADWCRMLGEIQVFRMADAMSQQGEFEGKTPSECDSMVKTGIGIINRYRLAAVSCACSVADFKELTRIKRFDGFRTPYAICAHTCMILLGNYLRHRGQPGRVAYFFEDGYKDAGDAHLLLSRVDDVPEMRQAYRHRSHKFVDKAECVALQGADLLAWESTKYWDETVLRKVGARQTRKSWVALGEADRESFRAEYRDRADLQDLMDLLLFAFHLPEPQS